MSEREIIEKFLQHLEKELHLKYEVSRFGPRNVEYYNAAAQLSSLVKEAERFLEGRENERTS